jgi:AsmA protein
VKKLLIGLAILVVLVLAAAIVAPFVIPVGVYETRVIAAVKAATGRDLKIAGPVHLSFLPTVSLEANDVALSNPAGAASPEMVRIKTLNVALQLMPLLHGAIAIERFELAQPVIALEIDKSGRPNWQFNSANPPSPTTATQPAKPPPAAQSGGSAGFPALTFAAVHISDGQASYLDQRNGARYVLSGINMELSLPGGDRPFAGKGSAVWNNETATISFQIDRPATLEGGGASPMAMTLAAKPINFAFNGNATGIALAKLDGGVDLSIPSIRGLATWLGVPFAPPGSGFGPLTLSGQVAVGGSKFAFSQAALSLDGMKGNGTLTLDSSGAVPAVSGRLDLDRLDVNAYLPPAEGARARGVPSPTREAVPGGAPAAPPPAPAPAPAASSNSASSWSEAPLDLAPLKLANADFALSTNALLYRKISIGRSALALHLKDGRLDADLSELALYQGKGQGKVSVDGTGATPAIAMQFQLSGVAVQPLLRDVAGFDKLVGNGNLTVDINGHGKSQREIVGTLAGKGSFNLANGKIEGIDLVAFTKKTETAITNALQGGGGGATEFGSLSGTYTISNGILHNDDLKLASPEIPMTGAGTVDLPKRTVAYRLTPSVKGVAVPVDVVGPWDNLSYRPDVSALAKELPGLIEQFQKKGSTSGSGGGVGGVLKGLLGR